MQVHLTLKSSNTKTGKIPVSTTSKHSCPDTCSFKAGGCYALDYHLNMHWNKVTNEERGTNWDTFCTTVSGFKPGQLWRHNQAGDLPGLGNKIDKVKIQSLVSANTAAQALGFTYTHKPVLGRDPIAKQNKVIIKNANKAGFTINLSADNLK